jgi:hypothetical protein
MSEVKEQIKSTSDGSLEQGEFKIKKKPKKFTNKKQATTKLDLSKKEEPKKEEDAISVRETKEIPVGESSGSSEGIRESGESSKSTTTEKPQEQLQESQVTESKEEEVDSPITVIEEVKEDEKKTEEVVAKVKEEIKENPQLELPENIGKLVNFMKETGGTVEDYVKLNKDYSKFSNEELLVQYYLQNKPHLNREEINFLLDDKFAWDEEVDDERVVRKKQLALKEEVAEAKNFLEINKQKYYDEIKLRPGVTQDQQKAMDFFNRYNKEQEVREERHQSFTSKTNQLFSDEFKGFDFKLGDKQFRYKVNNTQDVAKKQSDLNNFIGKFLDKNGQISDLQGYHKALYTAQNADTIASHFYEQGKTDAIRNMTAKSKNIQTEVRSTPSGDVYINGLKVRAISGVDSSKLKVKTKK